MAKNSLIEWTTHTFNPWWGCTKVSPACKHCYAETFAKRVGQTVWGKNSPRRFLSDQNWAEPLKWNARAQASGQRARVFCASMADVFEDRSDLLAHRIRQWHLIDATPHLDWQILTKRPELIASQVPWGDHWPRNVWIGTTIESQEYAAERLPYLAALPAAVRFVSAEPLLGPIDIEPWIEHIDWVITGGESGHHARPSSPSWFRDLRDACIASSTAFHFKQWGDWAPCQGAPLGRARMETVADGTTMVRVGKKQAGRTLDGRTWDELPAARPG